jgi:hypothetical protein
VPGSGLSSNNILEAGEESSSNWPDFTLHKKANRKRPATLTLAKSRITITLMYSFLVSAKIFPVRCEADNKNHNQY